MATVTELKPIPKGMITLLKFIHERMDAAKGKTYPQIIEISKDAKPFKITEAWNFEIPISVLNKEYLK
jgi:hypothetical protein